MHRTGCRDENRHRYIPPRPRSAAAVSPAPRSSRWTPPETASPAALPAPRKHFATPRQNRLGLPNRRPRHARDRFRLVRCFSLELQPAGTRGQSLPRSLTTSLSSLPPRNVLLEFIPNERHAPAHAALHLNVCC